MEGNGKTPVSASVSKQKRLETPANLSVCHLDDVQIAIRAYATFFNTTTGKSISVAAM
jgi:hypothetical protein